MKKLLIGSLGAIALVLSAASSAMAFEGDPTIDEVKQEAILRFHEAEKQTIGIICWHADWKGVELYQNTIQACNNHAIFAATYLEKLANLDDLIDVYDLNIEYLDSVVNIQNSSKRDSRYEKLAS